MERAQRKADAVNDVERVLGSLKDFQRDTVDYVFRRLWLDDDQTDRFLVADEVGLGKTMVAKGVIARTVEHLTNTTDKRIDIVYICSNGQIARQNLARLNAVAGTEIGHADRLTLLPRVIRTLRDRKINFVSFTPGTSFYVGSYSGASPERVLLYWMLAQCWGDAAVRPTRWKRFFEVGVRQDRFERALKDFDRSQLDASLCTSFGQAIEAATGPGGGALRLEIEACVDRFNYLRRGKTPDRSVRAERDRLVGSLRHLVARAAVEHLEPDLVILDEFQRFKDLLDADDEGAELANAIFDHPEAKVLMLSATPYKMYTLPDEPEGDDHYRDFTRTVRFLAGDDRAAEVERDLRTMRQAVLSGSGQDQAVAARDRVEQSLRKVMCRTERLAATPDRSGMLKEQPVNGLQLHAAELHSWCAFDAVARTMDSHDVFEYWRSTPYPLNLMERGSYQVRTRLSAAVEENDPRVRKILEDAEGLLDWVDVSRYAAIDPGNAKMRALIDDVVERGAWQLAWLPPSLPYYELDGAYARPEIGEFTKRLVFSAWTVVPKAISVMVSYDAERRAVEASGGTRRAYEERTRNQRLQFNLQQGRLAGMPLLGILYPALYLARIGDPLSVARVQGSSLPMSRHACASTIRGRLEDVLKRLPAGGEEGPVDQRWYWAAPLLLDRMLVGDEHAPFAQRMRRWTAHDSEDQESRLDDHIRMADTVEELTLGPRPDDLADVLTTMAIAAPGVASLRALSRVAGGANVLASVHLRERAFDVAQGLRSLFRKPEIAALLRSDDDDEAYWRLVLDHCLAGGLQAVLDEYAHMLLESEGLQDASAADRATQIAGTMVEALSIRAAANNVDEILVADDAIRIDRHTVSSHLAARFGRTQHDDKTMTRESTIRTAFNSPFRPFVLASTSVGQEGLDFHTYSHAVVHWNLPGNPVDLEQREGRVHRYKGHAVRKNVANAYGRAVLTSDHSDPWEAVFAAAEASRPDSESDISPFWVFSGEAAIERYVPAMPFSREQQAYRRLMRTVGAYRMVIGQPRQEDLLRYLGEDASWLAMDLTPPARNSG
jgi:hypothetical protein